MKKIILTIIVGIFLISLVSAEQQTLGTFKQNVCIQLTQTCGNCTYNNISFVYMTSDVILYNVSDQMTKVGTFYNYSFCDTSTIGEYIVNGFGDPDGKQTSWTYDFKITSTGFLEKSVLLNPLILIFLFIFIIFFSFALKTRTAWLGFISSIPLILAGIYTMIYGFDGMTNLYTRGISVVLLGLGLIIMIISAYDWVYAGEE